MSSPLAPASASPVSFSVTNGAVPKLRSSDGELRSMPICPVAAAPLRATIVPFKDIAFRVMRVPVEPSLAWIPAP